ncbi:Angiogenic factor with G patch and FHA domains 1, partial [Fragariocoptes setiger]
LPTMNQYYETPRTEDSLEEGEIQELEYSNNDPNKKGILSNTAQSSCNAGNTNIKSPPFSLSPRANGSIQPSPWVHEANATKTNIRDLVRECVQSVSSSSSSSSETLTLDETYDDYIYDEKTRTYYRDNNNATNRPSQSRMYLNESINQDGAPRSSSQHQSFISNSETNSDAGTSSQNSCEITSRSHTRTTCQHRNPQVTNESARTRDVAVYTENNVIQPYASRLVTLHNTNNNLESKIQNVIDDDEKRGAHNNLLTNIDFNTEPKTDEELEEGEVIDDGDDKLLPEQSAGQNQDDHHEIVRRPLDYRIDLDRVRTQYQRINPGSVRLIVLQSEVLDLGSLLIITPHGGFLGRLPACAGCIPDNNVARKQCYIHYDSAKGIYVVIQIANSMRPTKLNDQLLQSPYRCLDDALEALEKKTTEFDQLNHEDKLQLATSKFLVHIHDEPDMTCDWCEPGKVQKLLEEKRDKEFKQMNPKQKEQERRRQLNQLRRKHGLNNLPADPNRINPTFNPFSVYKDLAEERRKKVGSDNPYEKTDLTVSENPIGPFNIGHKLLSRMGWIEGQKLGTNPNNQAALSEPLQVQGNTGTQGLGSKFSHLTQTNRFHQFLSSEYHASKRSRLDDDFLER